MWWPTSLLVLLGILCSCYAVPYFDEAEAAALSLALQKLPENWPRTKTLGRLTCRDTDGVGTRIEAIEDGSEYLELRPTKLASTGVFIKNESSIDHELVVSGENQQNNKKIRILCVNNNNLEVYFDGSLVIGDVNDNEPIFARTNITYQTTITEILTKPVPLLIHPPPDNKGAIIVTDADGVDNSIVKAHCLSMDIGNDKYPCDGFFKINETFLREGQYRFNVYALRQNYTGYESFNLEIQAVNTPNDPAEPTLVSITQNVLINILDIQNLPPVIDKNALLFEMNEDLPPGNQVDSRKMIGAFDQDVGDPNDIRFELIPRPNEYVNGKFYLGPAFRDGNGFKAPLFLNNSVDREEIEDPTKTLFIDVMAIEYDSQNRPNRNPMNATATIAISVLDVNDQIPTFNRGTYDIQITELSSQANPENFYQISNNIEIVVHDEDSTRYNGFTVNIVSGNTNGVFKLNKNTGNGEEAFVLSAKESLLDYETQPNRYTIILRAVDSDRSDFTSEATVNIEIIDANDNSPVFSSVEPIFVPENTPPGTSVGRLFATDEDSGAFGTIVSYSLLDTSNTFTIDNNGNIYLNGTLDFETRKTYFFTATALDGGIGDNQNQGSVLVNVQVNNVNDVGPVFETNYFASLTEETTELIPSITIFAQSREDNLEPVRYSIDSVEPSGLTGNFAVDPVTGVVSVLNFIDYRNSDNGRIFVTFRATAGSLSSTTTAIITMVDLNNYAPRFLPSAFYSVEISELAKAGDVVVKLTVEDDDGPDTPNGQVTFQVLSGANDDFLIRPDTGVILVTGSANLDIENRQESYTLNIVARDKGDPVKSAVATVFIKLIDANNKDPVFDSALYTFQINEDDPVGASIGYINASDLDSGNQLRYSIDYNTVEYQKKGNRVTQSINAREIIEVEPISGLIKVAGAIDRQVYDRISFKAQVEDIAIDTATQPRQTGTASVVIFIRAAVDPRIYFALPWTRENPVITKTYSETKRVNYQIMPLTATDPVVPETVSTYRKIPSSDPEDYFYITGRLLYIQKALDYEKLPGDYVKKVSVVVEAISADQERTGTATIEIIVQDLNDNAPVFEEGKYIFYVPEDKTFTYKVGTAKATDADSTSYGQVEYFLTGSNSDAFYTYTERSGDESEAIIIVSETANLDFETLPVYNLLLFARDNPGGSDSVKFSTSVQVEIIIQDRNDMSPVFQEEVYEFSIIGTQAVGGDVGFILAEDGDAGVNGEVEYSVFNATNDGALYFGIETQDETSATVGEVLKTGRIFVKRSLENLSDRSLFELVIHATDRGSPPTPVGSCKVRITVSKGVQDLKPKWDEQLRSRVQIPENQPINTLVTTVLAYAADADSHIIYSFVEAGDSFRDYNSFNINATTGRITTAKVLDHEVKRTYNLLILATDSKNSSLTNQFLLTVQVIDVDDNLPSFLDCLDRSYNIPERATVLEEQPAGAFVFQAEACDLDQAPHNYVEYSWYLDSDLCLSQNLINFDLNMNTGVITTKRRLDRETIPQYLLCVEASQAGSTRRRRRDLTSDLLARTNHDSVLYVLVTVLDVNDLGPIFNLSSIKTVIPKYPPADVSVAEAYDNDLPPNNDIRYSIDSIKFIIDGKTQNAPTAFTVNGNDGTISIGTNDYSDYVGGFFDLIIRAEDYNGANVDSDTQLQRIYVTDRASRIRVVIDKAADEGVDRDARAMIAELNALDDEVYYEIETISYHVTSDHDDPIFDKTDICMVIVQENTVLSSVSASKQLNDLSQVKRILQKYGAQDPGPCDPATSVYPVGWESYWWVLVAFAIFIFICCVILIFLICVLYRQYKQFMDSQRTYLVPGN